MKEDAVFTTHEIASAFHVPDKKVRAWIKWGILKGYLLDGFLNYNVETDALVEFQETYPRYQYAVVNLLESKQVKFHVFHNIKRGDTFGSAIQACLDKPGFVRWFLHHVRNSRRPFLSEKIRIVLNEDWEKTYHLKEELKLRYQVLSTYKKRMEKRYASDSGLRKLEEELKELDEILKSMEQEN